MLKIAIQKSGRLFEDSVKLLKDAGLRIENSLDQLKAPVRGFDAEVLFLRNSDIPKYLESGVADIAVIGENVLREKEVDVISVEKLGFSKCRLSIALPKGEKYEGPKSLNRLKIATSYPVTLQQFLTENGVDASIHQISGSVEIAPNIGLADAVCDLVSSGSTLIKNGLVEQETILHSEAILASNRKSSIQKSVLIEQLTFRIRAVLEGRKNSYIMFNLPNEKVAEVVSVLPGLKSPTLLPLVDPKWSSLHTVIPEKEYWNVIPRLKEIGAEGILVIPIDKMIY